MSKLIRNQRLLEAVRRGMLGPKVASHQADDPVISKKLRGLARHLRHVRSCKRPHNAADSPSPPPPNPRFLKHVAFTRAKQVQGRIGAARLSFDPETKEVAARP